MNLIFLVTCAICLFAFPIASNAEADVVNWTIVELHWGPINCTYVKKDKFAQRQNYTFVYMGKPKARGYGGCLVLCDLRKDCHLIEKIDEKCWASYPGIPKENDFQPANDERDIEYYFNVSCTRRSIPPPPTTSTETGTSTTTPSGPTTSTPTSTGSTTSETSTSTGTGTSTTTPTGSTSTTSETTTTTGTTTSGSTTTPISTSTTTGTSTSSGSTSTSTTTSPVSTTTSPKSPCVKCSGTKSVSESLPSKVVQKKYANTPTLLQCMLHLFYHHEPQAKRYDFLVYVKENSTCYIFKEHMVERQNKMHLKPEHYVSTYAMKALITQKKAEFYKDIDCWVANNG
jgi:hypothetical protein